MNQTVKPDRPIWPSVPDDVPSPQTTRPEAPVPEIDPAILERPKLDEAASQRVGFEGFGSFSG
ncbi:hypothetical protein ASF49_15040 [Methylobacterium sp. Leaf104]|uniref:hypothetical protein n=1 Tax=Methylobacterium TaxID=407 RepID=UPI0006F5F3EC|nr:MULTISPECIES: hypothetical protein [Methylobacterium]KQP29982.1 hypothetical protein ASF49_15040 [Methylobacterium sp. Leaf104]MCI9882316.1 hypothetical protein [Methylobacterium goesingense]